MRISVLRGYSELLVGERLLQAGISRERKDQEL